MKEIRKVAAVLRAADFWKSAAKRKEVSYMLVSANHGLHGNRRGKARFTAFEAVEFLGKAGFEAVDVNFCCTTRRGLNHEALLDGDWRETQSVF